MRLTISVLYTLGSLSVCLCVKCHCRYNEVVNTVRVSGKLWRKDCVYLGEGGRKGGRVRGREGGREREEEGGGRRRKGGSEKNYQLLST